MRPFALFLALMLSSAALTAESAGGLRWAMPTGWRAQPERPMRAATYTVGAAAGDREPGECAVFFFGRGQGGSVQDNIDRWRSQIQGPDGKPAVAKIDKQQVRGLTITRVDSSGGYTGMGGPTAPSGRALPNYRLLGAVVEGPGGNNIFVKFTGPAATVASNFKHFEQLLASFQVDKQ
jgi:hypothetical protein